MRRTLLAGTALLVLLLAGCTASQSGATTIPTTSSTPTAGTQRPACQALATINTALASLGNVGDQTTIGQLKVIQKGLNAAVTVLDKVVPSDSSSTLADLKAANDQLAMSLADLPDSGTVGQYGPRLQQFKSQVAKAQSAASNLATQLGCSG